MTISLSDRPRNTKDFYRVGATPVYASRIDQRFSYTAYVPKRRDDVPMSLAVVVHGTDRGFQEYRDAFADFAEEHNCLIVAPLFPGGIIEAGDLHNYKFIEYHGIRFDELLLDMIDEIGESYDVDTERFSLFGFSGGGQFVHRFLILHPERLRAVSIGAPGRITQLDTSRTWWLGTADIAERFGVEVNTQAMSQVRIQLVVGADDVETWEINNPGDSNWMDGAEAAGRTRIDRTKTLADNLRSHGVASQLDLVPGAAHEVDKIIPTVIEFFGSAHRHDQQSEMGEQ